MYLEITNDIHLGLKFGCCNAENRKKAANKGTRPSNAMKQNKVKSGTASGKGRK